jgi:hypothetical protein
MNQNLKKLGQESCKSNPHMSWFKKMLNIQIHCRYQQLNGNPNEPELKFKKSTFEHWATRIIPKSREWAVLEWQPSCYYGCTLKHCWYKQCWIEWMQAFVVHPISWIPSLLNMIDVNLVLFRYRVSFALSYASAFADSVGDSLENFLGRSSNYNWGVCISWGSSMTIKYRRQAISIRIQTQMHEWV